MSLELRRPVGAWRRQVRERVPFSLRVGLRRVPHLVSWVMARPEPLPVGPALPEVICARTTPLRREGTLYEAPVQRGKEHNVARAARALHGRLLGPGEALSWHVHVGPPLARRGFVDGPELHDGRLALGMGGGVCQVANLVYWLAVHGGLQVVERHRHDLDLFPDHARDVPFGLGATVYWPWRDLVVHNPHPVAVRLHLHVHEGALHGRLEAAAPLGARWEVVEEGHRFVRRGETVWRENRVVRFRRSTEGPALREVLADHRARVAYPVPDDVIEEGA